MSPFAPYCYIQCPCSDSSLQSQAGEESSPAGADHDDDRNFDPRAPRSNYNLYPIEYLLYCDNCHEIRCPRCMTEEIAIYYCPNCLFEVPSSNIKSEGNRLVACSAMSRRIAANLGDAGAQEAAFNALYASGPSP